jgi:prevent-host-death family protein
LVAQKHSTPVTIPATDVHRNFGDLLRRAFSGREHFIVEKDGLPVVAIISKEEYDELVQEREQHQLEKQQRLKRFEQIARQFGEEADRRGIDEEQLMADLEKTKSEVYHERHSTKPSR